MTLEEAMDGVGRRVCRSTNPGVHGTIVAPPPETLLMGQVWIRWDDLPPAPNPSGGYFGAPETYEFVSDVPIVAPAVSRDFPSQCPRCGAAAYIGLRTVEHEHGGGCR
jgi:hypothetical protein